MNILWFTEYYYKKVIALSMLFLPAPLSPSNPKMAADFLPKPKETQTSNAPHAKPVQGVASNAHVGSPGTYSPGLWEEKGGVIHKAM